MFEPKSVSMLTCMTAALVAGMIALAGVGIAKAESSRAAPAPSAANFVAPPAASRNAADPPAQMDSTPAHRAIAIVTNGVITTHIYNGPGGLEISANAPGTITVASGSNAVTLHGNVVTISGAVALAPGATPGVTVSPNGQGGYTIIRDPQNLGLADAGGGDGDETEATDGHQTIELTERRKDIGEAIENLVIGTDR